MYCYSIFIQIQLVLHIFAYVCDTFIQKRILHLITESRDQGKDI